MIFPLRITFSIQISPKLYACTYEGMFFVMNKFAFLPTQILPNSFSNPMGVSRINL